MSGMQSPPARRRCKFRSPNARFGAAGQAVFGGPEQRFCPAQVYQYEESEKLIINAANCLHCKACSIEMPTGPSRKAVAAAVQRDVIRPRPQPLHENRSTHYR